MAKTKDTYKQCRFIDGKVIWVIVDEIGGIVDRNPSKKQLREHIIECYEK